MRAIALSASSVVLIVLLAACATEQRPAGSPSAQGSLYERLGGKPAIVKVVHAFVARVAADPRINGYFTSTDIPQLKQRLVEQICQASGGPCTYSGRSMKATHQGMGITNADFDALVEDLTKTLDEFKVPPKEQKELLSVLGPMRPDIVERS